VEHVTTRDIVPKSAKKKDGNNTKKNARKEKHNKRERVLYESVFGVKCFVLSNFASCPTIPSAGMSPRVNPQSFVGKSESSISNFICC